MLQRPSTPLRAPPLHHIIPTPVPRPSSLASPAAAIARIRGHASKDRFFSFPFFVSFLTNVTETLFTQYAGSENSCLSTTNSPPPCLAPQASQVPAASASPHASSWPPPSSPHASPLPPPPRHCAQDPPTTPTRHVQGPP